MNKLLTKIVGIALGATMAIGVGVAIASNNKETAPVYAGGSSTVTINASDVSSWSNSSAARDTTVKGIRIQSTGAAYSTEMRLYASQTHTFTSTLGNITKAEFTCTASGTSNYGPGKMSLNSGSAGSYTYSGTVGTWTGDSASFSLYGGQSRVTSIVFTYTPASSGKTVEATGVTITNGNVSLATASVGDEVDFDATVSYRTGSDYEAGSGNVTWTSTDEDVATINETTGVARVVGEGTTTITATAVDGGNPSASVTLEIEEIVFPKSFTILGSDFGTMSYTTTLTKTYSGLNDLSGSTTSVTIQEVNCLKNGSDLQSNSGKGSSVSNTTAIPGRIKTIVARFTVSGKNSTTLYLANGAAATSSSLNSLTGSSSNATQTFNVSALGNFNYFLFDLDDVSGAVYFTLEISFEDIPATLALKKNGNDISEASIYTGEEDNSVSIDIVCDNFGTGSVVFSKESSNTTILPLSNIVISGTTVTITSGSTPNVTGITVTITGTLNGKVASDSVLIKIMPSADDLIGIEVTNNPTKTSYNTGELLDLSGVVITATYDDGGDGIEAVVTNDCTFNPANGTEITADMTKVTVTYHGETAEITLTITVVVNYTKATSMNQIFDGQVVVLANSDGTAATKVYDGTSNNVKVAATTPVGGKIVSSDLSGVQGVTYTLERVNYDSNSDGVIDSTAWLLFDGTYYLYSAGTATSGKNYMKGKTTVDSDCYWQISFVSSALQIKSVNNTFTPYIRYNSSSTIFSCYNGATAQNAIAFYVNDTDTTGASAAKSFNDNYMHMDKNVTGQCNTYYPIAKAVWNDLETTARAKFIENHPASYQRLEDWASAKGDSLNASTHALESIRTVPFGYIDNNNLTVIVVIVSVVTLTAVGGYFFLRKRKEVK